MDKRDTLGKQVKMTEVFYSELLSEAACPSPALALISTADDFFLSVIPPRGSTFSAIFC